MVILVALLFLTEALSRTFSRVGFDSISLYVTELAMLAALGFAVWRCGVRPAFRTVADRIPLPLLALLWAAGAIAVIRGLISFDLGLTVEDVGLIDYTLLLVVVAVVVDSRPRLEAVTLALAFGGLATLLLFGIPELSARTWSDTSTVIGYAPAAVGLTVSFYLVWVAARLVHAARPATFHLVLAAAGLIVIGLAQSRGAWVALAAGLLTVALLETTWKRRALATGGVAAVVAVSILGTLGVEELVGGRNIVVGEDAGGEQTVAEAGGSGSGLSGDDDLTVQDKVETVSGGDQNASWRLAYWGELMGRSVGSPLAGAGFGEPSRFDWEGIQYDYRTGDPAAPFDVTGPHNGFVDVAYRMGIPALVAVLGLIGVALWRLRESLAGLSPENPDRLRQVTLLGMFAVAAVTAFFNDALRVPYLAIFFWALLGLLLVEGRIGRSRNG